MDKTYEMPVNAVINNLSIRYPEGTFYSVERLSGELQVCIAKDPSQSQQESEYDRGMRKAMQAIAKSCGKKFAVDVGYEDLPALVESIINPSKPPKTRTEYVKVTESIFDLKEEFERGELYCLIFGEYSKIENYKGLSVALLKDDCFYRRIEKEVDWREEVRLYLESCSEERDDFEGMVVSNTDWNFTYNPTDEEYLESCRIALRATGELE